MILRIRIPKDATALAPLMKFDKATGDFLLVFEVNESWAWHRPLRVARGETIPGTGRSELLDVCLLVEDETMASNYDGTFERLLTRCVAEGETLSEAYQRLTTLYGDRTSEDELAKALFAAYRKLRMAVQNG